MDLRGKGISSRHSYALDIYVIIKCRECFQVIYSYATRLKKNLYNEIIEFV